ncbi:MAG: bifunctional DNA primase/polymerase [Chloroflexota bacterium]
MHIQTNLNVPQKVRKAAKHYIEQEFSVIPAWGENAPDGCKFKQPAIAWGRYQTRRPYSFELHGWFGFGKHTALGLATGPVSINGLGILDIDAHNQYKTFCNTYPALAQTYTVRTRRGWHLYYHVPPTLHHTTCNRSTTGLDWLWQGKYAIAPPTTGYTIHDAQTPHTLTAGELGIIHALFDSHSTANTLIEHELENAPELTKSDLTGLYRSQAHQGNRNNALFMATCEARDCGWSLQQTMTTLIELHVQNSEQGESRTARYREASATIRSAYKRQPRPQRVNKPSMSVTIMESLFQHQLTAAVRVILGLRLLGYQDDEWLCRTTIIDALSGIVGKHSILKALDVTIDGKPLFEVEKSHYPPANAPHDASDTPASPPMREKRFAKPDFSDNGRQTHFYQLPSDRQLAEVLDVYRSRISESLTLDDLKSAKRTRQAAYRAYIARKPAVYANTWLCKRHGISLTTKTRYDREIPDLHKVPTYDVQRLTLDTLAHVPHEQPPGFTLHDVYGTRFPADNALATRLLPKRALWLCRQRPNYYWVGERDEIDAPHLINVRKPDDYRRLHLPAGAIIYTHKGLMALKRVQDVQETPKGRAEGVEQSRNRSCSARTSDNAPITFADPFDAWFARHLKQTLDALSHSSQQGLSLTNAQRWVQQYGVHVYRQALKIIQQRAATIRNPVGYYRTLLTSF